MATKNSEKLSWDLVLFETFETPSKYYMYDVETDSLVELNSDEYKKFRENGAWTNAVSDKSQIDYIINSEKKRVKGRITVTDLTVDGV